MDRSEFEWVGIDCSGCAGIDCSNCEGGGWWGGEGGSNCREVEGRRDWRPAAPFRLSAAYFLGVDASSRRNSLYTNRLR